MFGVAEEEDEELQPRVQEILGHLNEKPKISAVCEINLVCIGQSVSVLRNIDDCKSVYLSPDRTVEEQVTHIVYLHLY